MKKEIQISRKKLRTGVVVVLLTLILILLILNPAQQDFLKARFFHNQATPSPVDQGDGQAAAAALEAFYTLNYAEPLEQWEERVCALSTSDGCKILKTFFAPAVRQVVDANQVQTGCTVQTVAPVEDNGATRIWLLTVILDHPWPETSAEFQVYAEVAQVDGSWLFNRILFDQETSRFQTTPTP